MKMKVLFSGVLAGLLVLFVALPAMAEHWIIKKTKDYAVEVKFDKNPPVVGENNMTIVVKDASGKMVNDAAVSVAYSMPAMPGMPAMNYKTEAALKGDKYIAKMDISMAGPWNIAIKISRAGRPDTVKFTIDAH